MLGSKALPGNRRGDRQGVVLVGAGMADFLYDRAAAVTTSGTVAVAPLSGRAGLPCPAPEPALPCCASCGGSLDTNLVVLFPLALACPFFSHWWLCSACRCSSAPGVARRSANGSYAGVALRGWGRGVF